MNGDDAGRAELRASLGEFDGRATTILTEAAAKFSSNTTYFDDLIELVGDDDTLIGDGATWLLKRHLEQGQALSAERVAKLVGSIEATASWPAILHCCQSIRFLKITNDQAARLARWIAPNLDHKRPFIRAWSLDGICTIAKQHKSIRTEAERALKKATEDPAASVRARARNIVI